MNVNCSTCLEPISANDILTSTPCGYVFHAQCIIQWFETGKNNCLYFQAVKSQGFSLSELLPDTSTLHLMMMHPLRVQVNFSYLGYITTFHTNRGAVESSLVRSRDTLGTFRLLKLSLGRHV